MSASSNAWYAKARINPEFLARRAKAQRDRRRERGLPADPRHKLKAKPVKPMPPLPIVLSDFMVPLTRAQLMAGRA